MSNLQKMLQRVHAGEIDFGAFVQGTRNQYRAMACYLMRRWATPEWFMIEDVEQELYLETWRQVWRFNPEKGTTLQAFVVFNAMAAAKRAMHKARGVTISGSPDKKPSEYETPISQMGRDAGDGESMVMAILAEPAAVEETLSELSEVRHAATEALRACQSESERMAVLAIREAGSLDNAGAVLYQDMVHRIALRLGSEDKAERFVHKHATKVARRIQGSRVNPG